MTSAGQVVVDSADIAMGFERNPPDVEVGKTWLSIFYEVYIMMFT